MTVGEIVHEKRAAKGLTMRQLASKSGVSLSTITRLENNQQRPHFASLSLLAMALDTTAKEIMEEHNAGLREVQSSAKYH